jgi:hypothetical protein
MKNSNILRFSSVNQVACGCASLHGKFIEPWLFRVTLAFAALSTQLVYPAVTL